MGVKHEVSGQEERARAARCTRRSCCRGRFPARRVLRADYDEPGFMLELLNVRHHGPAKLRLGPEELNDDVLDEFGTWVLGADESFERFLEESAT